MPGHTSGNFLVSVISVSYHKIQVAQWAMIAHLGAIMFGDNNNLGCSKAGNSELEALIMNKFKHSRYYASSGYLQVLKRSE